MDKIKMGAMAAVTAGFTMITRAEQFYISGADWVGIMGMAYESIAAVSIVCLGGAALCCAFKAPGSNKFWNLLSVYYSALSCFYCCEM